MTALTPSLIWTATAHSTRVTSHGGSAKCKGYKQFPIYFSEGDLRQTVRYGFVDPESKHWESFSEFNHINDTVEWRLADGRPFATILRWFIGS